MDELEEIEENQLDEQERQLEDIEDRLELIEHNQELQAKALEFTNVTGPAMDWEKFEIRVRDMVHNMFRPSQKRVLELQDKVGKLCMEHTNLQRSLDDSKEEMRDALGIGKGPLRMQILNEVDRKFS